MKFTQLLVALAASTAVASPAPVEKRHYTFPSLTGTSAWQDVRQTVNYQSTAGLADVTSEQIRCYQSGTQGAKGITTIAAGSSVSFTSSPSIFHPGPLQFYMAKAPTGQDISTWDGSGQVWFKIYTEPPSSTASNQLAWASNGKATVSVTIPKSVPAGNYLLRIEHIALHQASAVGGAQFYLSCAQVTVTGGGSGTPSPLVSFPGAYSSSDPGIKINIWSFTGKYTPPGPAVWTG